MITAPWLGAEPCARCVMYGVHEGMRQQQGGTAAALYAGNANCQLNNVNMHAGFPAPGTRLHTCVT